jgi:hypothetical protein
MAQKQAYRVHISRQRPGGDWQAEELVVWAENAAEARGTVGYGTISVGDKVKFESVERIG